MAFFQITIERFFLANTECFATGPIIDRVGIEYRIESILTELQKTFVKFIMMKWLVHNNTQWILFLLLSLMKTCFINGEHQKQQQLQHEHERQLQQHQDQDQERPPLVMHTFYNRHNDILQDENEIKDHQSMLQIWTETWKNMGWDTKILTINDAKQHPQYDHYIQKLNMIPLKGKSGHVQEYNKLCYLRWLAMSANHVGGGWFSDFDALPLQPIQEDLDYELAQDSTFRVYHMGYVPMLLSGSQAEWNRMLELIIQSGLDKVKEDPNTVLWSDMYALQDVIMNRDGSCDCITERQVAEGRFVLDGSPMDLHKCKTLRKNRAIHFSHDAFRAGVIKEGYGLLNRGEFMADWWREYIQVCGSTL